MSDSEQLRLIAEQLLIVAQRRDELATSNMPAPTKFPLDEESRGPLRRRTNDDPISFADPDTLAQIASALYQTRRLRDRHFKSDLFADPAWDILLDLFSQKASGKRVSVTSACIASDVPPTTALRWITLLVDEGLITREGDEDDRRRAFLRLSKKGEIAVQRTLIDSLAYLRAAPRGAFAFGRGNR